jgi:hypothetical protein
VAALGAGKADKDGALDPYNGDVRLLTYCESKSSEPVTIHLLPGGVPSQLPVELSERICGAELVIHKAPFDLRFLLVSGVPGHQTKDPRLGGGQPRAHQDHSACAARLAEDAGLGHMAASVHCGRRHWRARGSDPLVYYLVGTPKARLKKFETDPSRPALGKRA